VIFEIGFHTDWRASEKYNLMLSDRRADQLKRYFIKEGVDSAQLSSKGYGENRPIHSLEFMEAHPQLSQTEIDKMHRENRRVVLKVIEINSN
jgi:OOP family OmpA-OmpF porin